MPLDLSRPFSVVEDEPPKFDPARPFSIVGEKPEGESSVFSLKPPAVIPSSIKDVGVFQPSQWSSGAGALVPPSENPDWAFTQAAAPGIEKWLTTPLIKPQTSPEDIAFREKHPKIGGVEAGVVDLAAGFTSPIGIATLGIGALPRAAQKAVSLLFAGQMAAQTPEISRELGTEFGKPADQRDDRKIAELITQGAGNLGFAALAGTHGLKPETVPVPRAQGPFAMGDALALPSGAQPPPEPDLGITLPQFPGRGLPAPSLPDEFAPKLKPAVPETPATPYETAVSEIRRTQAKTIADIQKLFPKANLNREQARVFRDAAWGPSATPKGEIYAPQERPQPADSEQEHLGVGPQRPPAETGGGNRPELRPPTREGPLVQEGEEVVAPPKLTATEVLKRGLGETSGQEILDMPNEEFSKLIDAKDENGAARWRLTQQAVEYGMKHNWEIVPELKRLQLLARDAHLAALDAGDDTFRDKTQFFGDAIQGAMREGPGYDIVTKSKAPPVEPKAEPLKPAEPVKLAAPAQKPRVAVTVRSQAADFNQLILDNAHEHGWATGQTLDDLHLIDPGKENIGSLGIKGAMARNKAMQIAQRNVARDLGLDPDQIGSESYRAKNLDKLKKFIGQKNDFKEAIKDTGDEGGKIPVDANELKVDETLMVDGAPFKVTAVNQDHVVLEDGRKFGIQRVPQGETLYVEGYEPAKPAVPKLRPGEKGTGDLLQGEAPFNLAGEKGVDTERIAKAKAEKEAAEKANAEFQEKNQVPLVPKSPTETLSTAKQVMVTAPKGATYIRVTEAGTGKTHETALFGKGSINTGDNPLFGSKWSKVEAGTIDKSGKFKPMAGDVSVTDKIGMGAAAEGEVQSGAGADIYGIAERVREERARAGQVAEVPPGEGISAPDSVVTGRGLIKAGADPEKSVAEFERTKRLSAADMAIVRAHGEELALAARRIEEKFGTTSQEYLDAWKALSDWDTRIKPMQTEWHKIGQAQQGETDIDTGTFTGLQRAYKGDTGKDFTPGQVTTAKKIAKQVKIAVTAAETARTKLYDQLELALGNVDAPMPKNLDEAKMLFAKFKSGNAFTPQQIKTLWNAAKKFYLDRGITDFDDVRNGLATDFGLSVNDVTRALAQPKGAKYLTDEMWKKQQASRRFQAQAKRWLRQTALPAYRRAIESVPRILFGLKVGFHGTVALGTHAPTVAFQPRFWNTYFSDFVKMYRMVGSPSYYEMQVQDLLRRPNYIAARRAGLVNDPFQFEDYNSPDIAQYVGRLSGMGNRGYSILKILRQDMFDQHWNKLPESAKTPEVAKAIADGLNHATGVVKVRAPKGANIALFAPRLEASRVAWLAVDPIKAANTFLTWSKASEADKLFAVNQVKEKAWVGGTLLGMLALNQGILSATGSKQKVNLSDPMRSDWLKFKAAGMDFSYGNAMLSMMRLPVRLYHIRSSDGGKLKNLIYPDEDTYNVLGQYGRSQMSPFAGLVTELWLKADYANRPLPGSTRPVPTRLRAQGIKPYTWPEFWSEQLTPIPVQEALREVWSKGLGMEPAQIKNMEKAMATIAVMGATGARLVDDVEPRKKVGYIPTWGTHTNAIPARSFTPGVFDLDTNRVTK